MLFALWDTNTPDAEKHAGARIKYDSLMKATIAQRVTAIVNCFEAVRAAAEDLFDISADGEKLTTLQQVCIWLARRSAFFGTASNTFSSGTPYLVSAPTAARVNFTGQAIEYPEDLTKRLREYITQAYPGAVSDDAGTVFDDSVEFLTVLYLRDLGRRHH